MIEFLVCVSLCDVNPSLPFACCHVSKHQQVKVDVEIFLLRIYILPRYLSLCVIQFGPRGFTLKCISEHSTGVVSWWNAEIPSEKPVKVPVGNFVS